jgi:proteasome lid subunit RPN8/RPN11
MALFFLVATLLTRPDAVAHYADLLARGGHGRLPVEHAGFLIEAEGTISFQPWTRGDFHRATFHGAVPSGTIAVVHTHPRALRAPSAHDAEEARRLGVPVVVVTPDAVSVVHPDASVERILQGRWLPR